jgi:hypothetical protein
MARVRSRRLLPLSLAVAALAVVAGCSGQDDKPKVTKAFCTAADRLDKELQHQSVTKLDIDAQIERVEELAATAPKAIEPQAEIYLEAMRAVKSDPDFRKDDPKVERAVDDVNRYASQGCNVYQREGGI